MTWKIALVGCGGVSSMHLDGYANNNDRVKLVAACDPDDSNVKSVKSKYGVPAGFSTVQDMICGASWDVAVVCTPTHIRQQVVSELAQAGKHIYVEKPMSSTLTEAREMVKICDSANVQLAVDQNFRYFYPFHLAKTAIENGVIGKVTNIVHVDTHFRQDSGWRTNEIRHALSVMAVHWFDGFRWILGEEPYAVYAQNRKSQAINCAGETDSTVVLSFPGGAVATCVQSFSSSAAGTSTLIIGDTATLRLTYSGMDICPSPPSGSRSPVHVANPYYGTNGENKPASAFAGLDHLLGSIESGIEAENSGLDNLRTIAILDAAYKSSESSAIVQISQGN